MHLKYYVFGKINELHGTGLVNVMTHSLFQTANKIVEKNMFFKNSKVDRDSRLREQVSYVNGHILS